MPSYASTRIGRPGLTTLLVVIVVSTAALMTSMVIAMRALSEVQTSLAVLHGQEADIILMGCMEEAMLQITRDASYAAGGVQLDLGRGTCDITVLQTSGGSGGLPLFTINLKATRRLALKCMQAQIAVPAMDVVSWTSVPCDEMA